MDTDKQAQEAAQWKKKYFDQLEDSERKEKQWTEADELLRRTISRLTLAADGLDDNLDQQLLGLRNAIRDRSSTAQLRNRIEDMSKALVKLDKQRKKREQAGDDGPLLDLLEALSLPRGTGRQSKALGKMLRSGSKTEPATLVKTFAALIHSSLELSSSGTQAAAGAEPGLLKRWFGKQAPGQGDAAAPVAASAPATAPASAPSRDQLESSRVILLHLLEACEGAGSAELNWQELRKKTNDADADSELINIADRLADWLAASGVSTLAADRSDTSIQEILIRLLERLSLPEEFVDRVGEIRDRIERMKQDESWDKVLEQIADLVRELRSRSQQEKKGIEDFLKQLSEQLQAVDSHLQGSEQFYDDSRQSGQQLDSAVKKEIAGIETSVREARELEELKSVVQSHVDTVLAHMEKHRAEEDRRFEEARQQISSMSARLHDLEDETESLRSRVQEERDQAHTDALTGIPNRLAYEERLEQEVARWKRFATPLVLLVWDVDHFKSVNDRFGHKAGDKVLKTIAGVLADKIRETDFLARYGGEEFVLLMTGSSLEECLPVADKLRSAIESTGFHFREEAVTITACCGLAEIRDGESMEQWFERADQALYRAKEAGRNRCELAS